MFSSNKAIPFCPALLSGARKELHMQPDFSIVRQDRFIQATRDSGYKSTESALSELIDNSIQAGAKRIAIRLIAVDEEYAGAGRQKQPRVVEVAIADNGHGMD